MIERITTRKYTRHPGGGIRMEPYLDLDVVSSVAWSRKEARPIQDLRNILQVAAGGFGISFVKILVNPGDLLSLRTCDEFRYAAELANHILAPAAVDDVVRAMSPEEVAAVILRVADVPIEVAHDQEPGQVLFLSGMDSRGFVETAVLRVA